jgi:uncharacterized protein YicC (UPF0701 family)
MFTEQSGGRNLALSGQRVDFMCQTMARSAAKLLSKDEERRIAANIAKLP